MILFQSGYIGIIGKPNVGKSTLLNRLLGEKIAIISPKPQSTRNRLLGVLTTDKYQLIFIDTPGIHRPQDQLHYFMMQEISDTIQDADVLLFMVEFSENNNSENQLALNLINHSKIPVILLINKIDLAPAQIESAFNKYKKMNLFSDILPISAKDGSGCDKIIPILLKYLGEGPAYYPMDTLTDKSERFFISEIIREKIFHLLHQEIPYSVAVVTEEVKNRPDNKCYIKSIIYIEKNSQKGILIGYKGKMLKKIGEEARLNIEKFLGKEIFLDLWVKVKNNWRKKPELIKLIGISGD